MKTVIWMSSSKEDLIGFPEEARREAGHQLFKLQRGEDPDDWKPMTSVGAGVREIRIHEDSAAFRVIYLATRPAGVYVLHCFQKKARKTRHSDLELARARYKAIPRDAKE
jgi:phage-related protein